MAKPAPAASAPRRVSGKAGSVSSSRGRAPGRRAMRASAAARRRTAKRGVRAKVSVFLNTITAEPSFRSGRCHSSCSNGHIAALREAQGLDVRQGADMAQRAIRAAAQRPAHDKGGHNLEFVLRTVLGEMSPLVLEGGAHAWPGQRNRGLTSRTSATTRSDAALDAMDGSMRIPDRLRHRAQRPVGQGFRRRRSTRQRSWGEPVPEFGADRCRA